jgi:hypothetical protein
VARDEERCCQEARLGDVPCRPGNGTPGASLHGIQALLPSPDEPCDEALGEG